MVDFGKNTAKFIIFINHKMKLYSQNPQNSLIATCRVTALLTKQKVQYVTVDDAFRKSEEYKKLTTTDKFPLLQTNEGGLHETTAICKYFCALADNKYLGSNAVQRSQVD